MSGARRPVFGVLLAICFCHMINDMLQSLLVATYPTLKENFHLTFAQIGIVTLAYQLTASLLQPLVGLYADRRPTPFSLPAGTLFTMAGLLVLSSAASYGMLLTGAAIVGIGSSVFHPESSRVARMASGGRPGLAQSLFQVGGNVGGALGPLGAVVVVERMGQRGLGVFSTVSLVATVVLARVGLWYKTHGLSRLRVESDHASGAAGQPWRPARTTIAVALAVLLVLMFSKFVFLASFSSYLTFYLMERFGVSVGVAQLHLFAVYAGVAVGTLAGGPMGDRFGRKHIIWFSILGVLPFTLVLPYANLFWTGVLTVVIGLILSSAFPAIVVYAQELLPNRVGTVAGLFFGLSFGFAGVGAALLGALADSGGLEHVYRVCSFLPALGIFAALLPSVPRHDAREAGAIGMAAERA